MILLKGYGQFEHTAYPPDYTRVEYGSHATEAIAWNVLGTGVDDAISKGWTWYDWGVTYNDATGLFDAWAIMKPPVGGAVHTEQMYDVWERETPETTTDRERIRAFDLATKRMSEEKETSIWPWVAVGGGAILLLAIAGIASAR